MSAIFGSAPAFSNYSNGECTFVMSTGATLSIMIDTDTDLQSSRDAMGASARDITVGGLPGLSGVVVFVPTVHVQRGNDQLQVTAFSMTTDDAFMAQLVQVATVAVSHWP
jgi:hypothetical protein